MGEVIGYKGTPESRLKEWNTLKLLRRCIVKKVACDREKDWYAEDLLAYTKVA